MNTTITAIGIAFLGAAAVGGGLKAAGVETPLISTIPRQLLLACVGVVALVLGEVGDSGAGSPTPAASGSPGATQASTSRAAGPSSGDDSSSPGGGGPSDGGYVAEYSNVAFTMPAPQGDCNDEVGVTFAQEGPRVATDVNSALVGDYITADLFYDNCNLQNSYNLIIPHEDPVTRVDHEPGPQECATRATQQPVGRNFPFAALRAGMRFCLLSPYNHQLAYLTLTRVSPNHDLAWTASGWQAPDS